MLLIEKIKIQLTKGQKLGDLLLPFRLSRGKRLVGTSSFRDNKLFDLSLSAIISCSWLTRVNRIYIALSGQMLNSRGSTYNQRCNTEQLLKICGPFKRDLIFVAFTAGSSQAHQDFACALPNCILNLIRRRCVDMQRTYGGLKLLKYLPFKLIALWQAYSEYRRCVEVRAWLSFLFICSSIFHKGGILVVYHPRFFFGNLFFAGPLGAVLWHISNN